MVYEKTSTLRVSDGPCNVLVFLFQVFRRIAAVILISPALLQVSS